MLKRPTHRQRRSGQTWAQASPGGQPHASAPPLPTSHFPAGTHTRTGTRTAPRRGAAARHRRSEENRNAKWARGPRRDPTRPRTAAVAAETGGDRRRPRGERGRQQPPISSSGSAPHPPPRTHGAQLPGAVLHRSPLRTAARGECGRGTCAQSGGAARNGPADLWERRGGDVVGAESGGAGGGAGGESAPAALPVTRLRSHRRAPSPPFPRGDLLSSPGRSARPGPARGVPFPGAFLCAPTSPRLSCAERSP